jgi:predicted transcriptional regulator
MTRRHLTAVAPSMGTDIPGHTPDAPYGGTDIPGHTLAEVHAAYTKWFGAKYDLQALDCVLAAAAGERLAGDPAWLLLVGGPGAAKTETIMPIVKAQRALAVSTINGEAALLSGTSKKDRAKTATGGLLPSMGSRGLLIIKDVTTILSMNRDSRALVLAALREVYDGSWSRTVGTDGGQTIRWSGWVVVIGAVTTAWDAAHQVIATMGDRFLLVRLTADTQEDRRAATLQAMGNVNREKAMRDELSAGVSSLLDSVDPNKEIVLTAAEIETLISTADVVTRTRTAVERDFQGNPAFAHALEMPTRFGKQLVQIVRGGIAIGMTREAALAGARRCAADSLPPLRLKVLRTVLEEKQVSTASAVRKLKLPRNTVDRALKELQLLGMLTVDEVEGEPDKAGRRRKLWQYSVSPQVDGEALADLTVSRNVTPSPGGTA